MQFPVVAGLSVVMVLGFVGVAPQALAQGFFAGNKVYEDCQTPSIAISWGMCRGYVTGAIDAFLAENAALHLAPRFCIPEGVTIGQLADVAMQYISNHPEERHLNAASLVWVSVFQAFPCNSKR